VNQISDSLAMPLHLIGAEYLRAQWRLETSVGRIGQHLPEFLSLHDFLL
jgi:hypothetical protein